MRALNASRGARCMVFFCDLPIIIILARAALIDRHEEDRGHEAL